MDFNLRVFISSTSVDLLEYRQAADRAIRSLGATSDDMVLWSADERDGATVSVDRVRQSDVVVSIVAHRYGYVPDGAEHSITEQEYLVAKSAGIPVLAFLLDESVPWPPKFIERERPAELARFREVIERDSTRRLFRSPDELARLITQSLVSFTARRGTAGRARRLARRTLAVVPAVQLRSQPDGLVPLGHAEDDSPLLLRVERSVDFAPLLKSLASVIERSSAEFPSALFSTFEQSLEQYTRAAWAKERLVPVTMRDGTARQMYVTGATLSELFRPLLASILSASKHDQRPSAIVQPDPGDEATAIVVDADLQESSDRQPSAPPVLQSVGGRNRFLGVSLDDGAVLSVGFREGQCVEWRPFVCESLPTYLPNASFVAHWSHEGGSGEFGGSLSEYQALLDQAARESPSPAGTVRVRLKVTIAEALVAALIADIATRLAENLSRAGKVHGDLKAGNVILARGGPLLIDQFDLTVGARSPGWSPNWSAPEQVLGLPVSAATDVYPLGIMLVQLLGGRLVGEVRKFRTSPTADGRNEFDVFYDPSIYTEDTEWDQRRSRWVTFARSCLRFDPEKRCHSAAAFADRLRTLLAEDPLPGHRYLHFERELWAATLLDGSDRLADVVSEGARGDGPVQDGTRPA